MTTRSLQRSALAAVVLAMLSEEPMHAYRMHELIKRRGKDSVVNVAQRNSVYQTIARLLRMQLIRVHAELQEPGRPERVVYEITDEGRVTLAAWLKDMLAIPLQEYPEFPAALALLPVLAPKEVLSALKSRATTLQASLDRAETTAREMQALHLPRLFLIEDEYKQAMLKAELAWLQAVVADLGSKALDWNARWLKKVASDFEAGSP